MKKLAVLAALTIMSLSVFAQKAVVANNNYDANTFITGGSGTIYVQLMGAAAGGTLAPVADQAGVSIFTVDAGQYDAGVGIVPGMTATGPADFELRAWSGNADPTKAAFSASQKFSGTANGWNDAAVPPAAPNGAPLLNIPSLTLAPVSTVPEPSTLALGLIGAAALLIRRRK